MCFIKNNKKFLNEKNYNLRIFKDKVIENMK